MRPPSVTETTEWTRTRVRMSMCMGAASYARTPNAMLTARSVPHAGTAVPATDPARRLASSPTKEARTRQEITARAETSRLIRSEEQTPELQSLMRNSYAVSGLKKKKHQTKTITK